MGITSEVVIPPEIYLFSHLGYQKENNFDKIDDLEGLWDRLVRADKSRDVMVSISTGDLPNAEDLGLVENHAYAVLEFKEFEDK